MLRRPDGIGRSGGGETQHVNADAVEFCGCLLQLGVSVRHQAHGCGQHGAVQRELRLHFRVPAQLSQSRRRPLEVDGGGAGMRLGGSIWYFSVCLCRRGRDSQQGARERGCESQ